MGFLFDTNILVHLHRKQDHALAEKIQSVMTSSGISCIAAMELYYGAARSSRPEDNFIKVHSLLDIFPVLDYTREDAHETALIRSELAREGTPIGPFDVCIAGQARARNLVMVTANTREFERVSGLRVENWLIAS